MNNHDEAVEAAAEAELEDGGPFSSQTLKLLVDDLRSMQSRAEAAEAKNERLREAVRHALCNLEDPSDPVTGLDETRKAAAILRAALNTPE